MAHERSAQRPFDRPVDRLKSRTQIIPAVNL
jgi:hypothetical protein